MLTCGETLFSLRPWCRSVSTPAGVLVLGLIRQVFQGAYEDSDNMNNAGLPTAFASTKKVVLKDKTTKPVETVLSGTFACEVGTTAH